jgi:hypothetical protein
MSRRNKSLKRKRRNEIIFLNTTQEIIKKIWENDENPNLSGFEITPDFHLWIARNFYPSWCFENGISLENVPAQSPLADAPQTP